jgi:hypothetical protein
LILARIDTCLAKLVHNVDTSHYQQQQFYEQPRESSEATVHDYVSCHESCHAGTCTPPPSSPGQLFPPALFLGELRGFGGAAGTDLGERPLCPRDGSAGLIGGGYSCPGDGVGVLGDVADADLVDRPDRVLGELIGVVCSGEPILGDDPVVRVIQCNSACAELGGCRRGGFAGRSSMLLCCRLRGFVAFAKRRTIPSLRHVPCHVGPGLSPASSVCAGQMRWRRGESNP